MGIPKNSGQSLLSFRGVGQLVGKASLGAGIALGVNDTVDNVQRATSTEEAQKAILLGTADIEAGIALGVWPIGTIGGSAYYLLRAFASSSGFKDSKPGAFDDPNRFKCL